MKGKYDSLRDEVVDRKANDQSWVSEQVGDSEIGSYVLVEDLYGKDYIVHTMSNGRVEVEQFDHNDDGTNSRTNARLQWAAIEEGFDEWYGTQDDDEPDDDERLEMRQWADELRREEDMLDRLNRS